MGLSARHIFDFSIGSRLVESFSLIEEVDKLFLVVRPLARTFAALLNLRKIATTSPLSNSNHEGYITSAEEAETARSDHEADE